MCEKHWGKNVGTRNGRRHAVQPSLCFSQYSAANRPFHNFLYFIWTFVFAIAPCALHSKFENYVYRIQWPMAIQIQPHRLIVGHSTGHIPTSLGPNLFVSDSKYCPTPPSMRQQHSVNRARCFEPKTNECESHIGSFNRNNKNQLRSTMPKQPKKVVERERE